MNENLNYLQLILCESELNFPCMESNLKFIEERQLFNALNQSERSEVISLINAKLHSTGKERIKALHLMKKFLPQCISDTFSDFALAWMQQCCRWNVQSINEEIQLLCDLIENSVNHMDVKKQVISDILPRFVDRLKSVEDNASISTVRLKLKCLKIFMDHYNSACIPHRNYFQKYVIHCLKQYSEMKQIVKQGSLCFVLLCQCYNKGQLGTNYREAWSLQWKALIDTGHKLFSIMYYSVDVLNLAPEESMEHTIPGLLELNPTYEKISTLRFYGWKTKFFVISKLLQAMLRCKYPVSKSFQPVDLLNLVCRFLSVNEIVLKKCTQTNEILALTANLSDVHEYAFDVLRALISCAKRNLIPYGVLICKLCLQSLKWTQSSGEQCGSLKPFQSLRCKVYRLLSHWLSISDFSSSIEILADEIIPIAISDIEFVKPVVKLTINSKQNKKRKRKREQTRSELCRQPEYFLPSTKINNKEVCVSAHQMLQLLFSNASILIKFEHYKNVQHTVISLIMETFNATSALQYPTLYSDAKCRLQLFETLFNLTIQPHWKWKMSTSLTGKILELGTNDSDINIVTFCKYALGQLEVVIHPRGPTLLLPHQTEENSVPNEIVSKFDEQRKTISNGQQFNVVITEKSIINDSYTEPVIVTEKSFANGSCEKHSTVIENAVCESSKDSSVTSTNLQTDAEPVLYISQKLPENKNPLEISNKYQNDNAIFENHFSSFNDCADYVNKERKQSLHSCNVSVNDEDEYCSKKLKTTDITITSEANNNSDIASMLNDFVDILQ